MFQVGLTLFTCAWLAGCRCGQESVEAPQATPKTAAERPNVLILMWDTARADRMSLYGHERQTTPHLEELANDARVYEQAISPAMWTVPSHASLFTGLPVASHGAHARWIWLDERFETLAERFAADGYETWAWSANPYLSDASNLLQGFETVHMAWDGGWSEAAGRATMDKRIDRDASVELGPAWEAKGGRGWPAHLVAYKDSAPVANEALLDWLDHRPAGAGPFLAYVNLLEAHHPRIPSMASRSRLLEAELLEAGLATDGSLFRTMMAMEGHGSFEASEVEAIRAVYDAALSDLDVALGDLVRDLRDRELLDRTVVVVVSDHGEHLGEHGLWDHRWSVHQELIRVPLVVRYPNAVSAGRVTSPVSTQQLFPTLCVLTDVPCPDLPVSDLLGPVPERVYSELIQPTPRLPPIRKSGQPLDPAKWRRRFQVAVEGSRKLVRASDARHALYDLSVDPGEVDSKWGTDPAGEALLEAIRVWRNGITPYDPAARSPEDRPRPALAAGPGTAEQLEMLGYTSSDEPGDVP